MSLPTLAGMSFTTSSKSFGDGLPSTMRTRRQPSKAALTRCSANVISPTRFATVELSASVRQREDKIVAAAKGILRDADLAGPNDQFGNALAAFNRRPEPDTENCVKDAVGAAEG